MSFLDEPPLVFALAMIVGVVAQALGRHVLIPGIVVLLGAGILLGPDGANLIRPEALGAAQGAILEDRMLVRSRVDARTYAVAVTSNEGVNLLFARRVLEDFYGPRVLAAVDPRGIGVNPDMIRSRGASVLFGQPQDLATWISRWRRGRVELQRRGVRGDHALRLAGVPEGAVLPVLVQHGSKLHLIDENTSIAPGDVVDFVVATERRELAEAWFASGSWGDADAGRSANSQP